MNDRRIQRILLLQGLWAALVLALGLWWNRLILTQAGQIELLERLVGLEEEEVLRNAASVKRMIYWEGGTYLLLTLAAAALLMWLYVREQRRAKSVQAFFASVTHELKTPLTSIRLQAESLQEEHAESRHLARLLEDTLRLESQVERTLELARVEGGGQYHPMVLNLRQALGPLLAPWQEAYRGRVDFQLSIDDVDVYAEPAALAVVLRNLIENALKHGGGAADFAVRVSTKVGADEVSLVVEDTGRGYGGDEAHLGRLYQKGKGSSGAGVGLYLVKTLMDRMRGKARFEGGAHGFRAILTFIHPHGEARS